MPLNVHPHPLPQPSFLKVNITRSETFKLLLPVVPLQESQGPLGSPKHMCNCTFTSDGLPHQASLPARGSVLLFNFAHPARHKAQAHSRCSVNKRASDTAPILIPLSHDDRGGDAGQGAQMWEVHLLKIMCPQLPTSLSLLPPTGQTSKKEALTVTSPPYLIHPGQRGGREGRRRGGGSTDPFSPEKGPGWPLRLHREEPAAPRILPER